MTKIFRILASNYQQCPLIELLSYSFETARNSLDVYMNPLKECQYIDYKSYLSKNI